MQGPAKNNSLLLVIELELLYRSESGRIESLDTTIATRNLTRKRMDGKTRSLGNTRVSMTYMKLHGP